MDKVLNSNLKVPSEPEIRFLGPEDAPELMRIRHRAIGECAENFGTPVGVELKRGVDYYRRKLLRYQNFGYAAMLGGWEGEVLSGITGLRTRTYHGQEVGLIYSTFVEKSFRSRGVGKYLVEEACRQIQVKWGLRHFMMNVEVHNENALKLYQNCGFAITGQEKFAFCIDGDSHDVYVLERNA